jgi:hypothetical protein
MESQKRPGPTAPRPNLYSSLVGSYIVGSLEGERTDSSYSSCGTPLKTKFIKAGRLGY